MEGGTPLSEHLSRLADSDGFTNVQQLIQVIRTLASESGTGSAPLVEVICQGIHIKVADFVDWLSHGQGNMYCEMSKKGVGVPSPTSLSAATEDTTDEIEEKTPEEKEKLEQESEEKNEDKVQGAAAVEGGQHKDEYEDLKAALAESNTRSAQLEQKLKETEAHAAQLEKNIATLESSLRSLESGDKKTVKASDVRKSSKEAESEPQALRADDAALTADNLRLKDESASHRNQIAAIEERAAELEATGAAIEMEVKRLHDLSEMLQAKDDDGLQQAAATMEKSKADAVAHISELEVADGYRAEAIDLEKEGQFDQALELYDKALAIKLKALGPEHPDVAIIHEDKAILLKQQGHYDRALELYDKTLGIRLKVLGPEHLDLARTYSNKAIALDKLGRRDEARELRGRAAAIKRKAGGR